MIEILSVLAATLFVLLAARKGRRRRKRVFLLKGAIDKTVALSTLALGDVISDVVQDSVTETAFAISCELVWSLREVTVGEGPIQVGLAHSDYSDAEIEEYLENTGSWEIGDLVQREIAGRKVRIVGSFDASFADQSLNEGQPIKTTLKWMLATGQTLRVWAWNKSAASPLTTGALVVVSGHVWLRPT